MDHPFPAPSHLRSDDELVALLAAARSVAVVGASDTASRPSNGVTRALLTETRYQVWPVTPTVPTVLGHRAYPRLADLPAVPDLVDVFRRPAELDAVLADAVAVGARAVWFQLGLGDDALAARAVDAGLAVVTDRCLKVDHARLRHRLPTP